MNAVVKPPELKPGIYEGLPMAEYLAMPAASASLMCKILERCPRAAWHDSWLNPKRQADDNNEAQSIGTAAHSLLLEGNSNCVQVIDPRDHPNEKGGGHAAGWTNKSIKAAKAAAIAAGKVPMLPEDMQSVVGMVDEARAYLETVAKTEPAVYALFQPSGGKSEVTIVWEEDGFLFRMRPGRWSSTLAFLGDVKTTKTVAEPDRWGRTQLFGMSYYIAAAFYRRGMERATGKSAEYVYLTQEQDAPYLCSLIGLDPAVKALGDRKIDRAMRIWKDCMRTGRWPGYPDRVAYPEAPKWELAREDVEPALGSTYDYPDMGWKKPEDREVEMARVHAMFEERHQ